MKRPLNFEIHDKDIKTLTMRDVQIQNLKLKKSKVKTSSIRRKIPVEQAQAFKDKYLVSDKCYVGIRKFISRNLPGIKKLRKQRDVLRTEMQIKRNSFGYFNVVQK